MIIEGFKAGLNQQNQDFRERIETFLPDPSLDYSGLSRFEEGRVIVLKNRSTQSRRFRMVHACDVVVSIEGDKGTRSVLDVALAIERPLLPLPFGDGTSALVWQEERAGICDAFQLTRSETESIERIRIANLTSKEIRSCASMVRGYLMRGFTGRCFVIMPFDNDFDPVYEEGIEPALSSCGFQPFRTDKHLAAGNVIEAIRDGLRHCYFAIAETTGDRPNVMYELGMAHAYNKPVILLRRYERNVQHPNAPFDLGSERLLIYGEDLTELRERLKTSIRMLTGKPAGAVNEQ